MSKVKDVIGLVNELMKEVALIHDGMDGVKGDLYDTVKQVHETKYQLCEFDLRLSNLEKWFKEQRKGEVR